MDQSLSINSNHNSATKKEELKKGIRNGSAVNKKMFICNFCKSRKSTLREFTSHVTSHIGAMPYYCLKCPYSSISLTQLYIHLVKHVEFVDNDEEKKRRLRMVLQRMVHVCNICNTSFKFYVDLLSHYAVHMRNFYKCVKCSYVFSSESDCLIHSHLHDAFSCRVCSKEFGTRHNSVYLDHVRGHDFSKLYRKFPKTQVDYKTVPYYQTFFNICLKISSLQEDSNIYLMTQEEMIQAVNSLTSDLTTSDTENQFDISLEEVGKAVLEKQEPAFTLNSSSGTFECHTDDLRACKADSAIVGNLPQSNLQNTQEACMTFEKEAILKESFSPRCESKEHPVVMHLRNTSPDLTDSSAFSFKFNEACAEDEIKCIDIDDESSKDTTNSPAMEEDVSAIGGRSLREKARNFTPATHKKKPVNAVQPFSVGEEIISFLKKRNCKDQNLSSKSDSEEENYSIHSDLKFQKLKETLLDPTFSATVARMWDYDQAMLKRRSSACASDMEASSVHHTSFSPRLPVDSNHRNSCQSMSSNNKSMLKRGSNAFASNMESSSVHHASLSPRLSVDNNRCNASQSMSSNNKSMLKRDSNAFASNMESLSPGLPVDENHCNSSQSMSSNPHQGTNDLPVAQRLQMSTCTRRTRQNPLPDFLETSLFRSEATAKVAVKELLNEQDFPNTDNLLDAQGLQKRICTKRQKPLPDFPATSLFRSEATAKDAKKELNEQDSLNTNDLPDAQGFLKHIHTRRKRQNPLQDFNTTSPSCIETTVTDAKRVILDQPDPPKEDTLTSAISTELSVSCDKYSGIHSPIKRLSVRLQRLPDEILIAAMADSNAGDQCGLKELRVVAHKLPAHVCDFKSFVQYEKKRKRKAYNTRRSNKQCVNSDVVPYHKDNLPMCSTNNDMATKSSVRNCIQVPNTKSFEVSPTEQHSVAKSKTVNVPNNYVNQEDECNQSASPPFRGDKPIVPRSLKELFDSEICDIAKDVNCEKSGEDDSLEQHQDPDDADSDADSLASDSSTTEKLQSLKHRAQHIKNLLESMKETQKVLGGKELRVELHKLPHYIVETYQKNKPIMLSNILPVIRDVQSVNKKTE